MSIAFSFEKGPVKLNRVSLVKRTEVEVNTCLQILSGLSCGPGNVDTIICKFNLIDFKTFLILTTYSKFLVK